MKVFDAFAFFNELDLLDIRLNLLDPYVDYFILSEATKTFQGGDKPLWYQENKDKFEKLYDNQENIKFVQDALFGATNEPMGTSYRSRHVQRKYIYAGKTGTSQTRRITKEERELKLKQSDLPYERRDHALFTAFAPYKDPRYAISVVIEHGGTGSSGAAPIAKKVIKKVLDRHKLRKKYQINIFEEV